jgi:Putative serine esterase (DUF676)
MPDEDKNNERSDAVSASAIWYPSHLGLSFAHSPIMKQKIHLLVCVHGLWGSPGDLGGLALEAMTTFGNKEGGEYEFDLLVPEKNSGGAATYDGIDWCGERVADEACQSIRRLARCREEVTKHTGASQDRGY